MTTPPRSVSAMTPDELAALFKSMGEPAFRAGQLFEFFFRKGIASYAQVTNLSKALRARLSETAPLYELALVTKSPGDQTTKWLWRAADGASIESVQIFAPERVTACLSCQVGCAMGCAFCATGLSGFERHLKAHEILEQYLQMWAHSGVQPTNVVFMGMGEPLHNYDAVMEAVRKLNQPPPNGVSVGARRITISTVGIVPGIIRLAGEKLQLELAVSLHAPDEATRQRLIPASRRYPIKDVMAAVEEFSRRARRLVTYEYVLLAGVNDSPEQARELIGLLQTHPCKVNLIPYNPVPGSGFECPSAEAQEHFKLMLEKAHIPVTVRYSKGRSVDAACGQLRRRVLDAEAQTQPTPKK